MRFGQAETVHCSQRSTLKGASFISSMCVLLWLPADRVSVEFGNILRFQPLSKYDFIWSARLYDYFEDRIFEKRSKNLRPLLSCLVNGVCKVFAL